MKIILRAIRDMKTGGLYVFLAAGFVALGIRDVCFAFSLGGVLDGVLYGDIEQLYQALVYLGASALISIPLQIWVSYADRSFSTRGMNTFMKRHIQSLVHLPEEFYDRGHTGDTLSRMTGDFTAVNRFMSEKIGYICCQAVYSIDSLIYMGIINPIMMISGYIITPIILWALVLLTKEITKHTRSSAVAGARSTTIAQDCFEAIDAV